MLNLVALVNTAFASAAAVGVTGTVTFTRPAGMTINPTTNVSTGSAATVSTTRGVEVQGTAYRTRAGAWHDARAIVMVPASDLATYLPVIGDLMLWAGKQTRIVEVDTIAPDGVNALFWVFAAGGA